MHDHITDITTLPSGLRVATRSMPGFSSVAMNIWVDAGSRYETKAENGLSHLLEHMAFKGTTTRSARDIAEEFDMIGGQLNAWTSTEYTVYHAKVLQEHMEEGLEILADILQRPTYDPEELERERMVVLQEIAMQQDTPDDLVFDYFQERAYPGQPLGRSILGPAEQVRSYDSGQLRAYQQAHYHAGNMAVTAAGAVNHADFCDLVSRLFEDLPTAPATDAPPARYDGGGEKRENKDLEQVQFVLGFEGLSYRDPDYYTQQLFSLILGGGMSSRLFQEIREKRGLVYTVSAMTSGYRDGGLFLIHAGTGEKECTEMIPVLCAETLRVLEDLEEEELVRAKNQVRSALLMARERNGGLAEMLGRHLLAYGRIIPLSEILATVEAIEINDITRIARRILTGSRPTLAAIGPLGSLESYDDVAKRLQMAA